MKMLDQSEAIFSQLRATPGNQAVRTLIENQEAWRQAESVMDWRPVAPVKAGEDAVREGKIARQLRQLEKLVVRLPVRYASAG